MIIIDTREPRQIGDSLQSKNIPHKYATLVLADYLVNSVYLERKTWSDFFQSYQSGRLYKQMLQLHQHQPCALILEGFFLDYISHSEAFYSLLTKILFCYNVKIIFTLNIDHTAAFLAALHRTTQHYISPDLVSSDLPRLIPYNIPLSLRKRYILSCFPTIGEKKAQNILARCPSLRQLFVALPDELHNYGIGKRGQKAFQEILD